MVQSKNGFPKHWSVNKDEFDGKSTAMSVKIESPYWIERSLNTLFHHVNWERASCLLMISAWSAEGSVTSIDMVTRHKSRLFSSWSTIWDFFESLSLFRGAHQHVLLDEAENRALRKSSAVASSLKAFLNAFSKDKMKTFRVTGVLTFIGFP